MTAPVHSFHVQVQKHHSRDQDKGSRVKNFAQNASDRDEVEKRRFARMLWKAFPEATSERELAELVAEVLTNEQQPVHWKTVRNWLQGDNTPHFRYVMRVIALVGIECLLDIIDVEDAA